MPMATREEQRAFQRQWVARRRAAFFADKDCSRCGSTDDLHLHHRNPEQKVAHAIWSWREERRLAEIVKCDVLCRSCHEEHHAAQREQHGTRTRYRKGCRCDLCRWAKAKEGDAYRRRRKLREAA